MTEVSDNRNTEVSLASLEGKEKERTDAQLDTEVSKTADNGIAGAMDLMAQKEIGATIEKLSPDERHDSEYMSEFADLQETFSATTQEILSSGWTPEEKIKKLEDAFKEFQTDIWDIRGTKEAEDAQRARVQGENMQTEGEKSDKWSQEFKEHLLKNLQESTMKRLQEKRQRAQAQWDAEQFNSQRQAEMLASNIVAFWPMGSPTENKTVA